MTNLMDHEITIDLGDHGRSYAELRSADVELSELSKAIERLLIAFRSELGRRALRAWLRESDAWRDNPFLLTRGGLRPTARTYHAVAAANRWPRRHVTSRRPPFHVEP
jgi:hypothetical protein